MQQRFEALISEIKVTVKQVEADQSLNKQKLKYYRGIQILFSPLVYRPKFMFIGINPGAGCYSYFNKNVQRYNALDHFEYLHYNYLLAREVREVFAMAELADELKHSVKSNCFFLATANEKNLHQFLSHLKKNYNIYTQSRKWIRELIDITQPEIIICEGKSAIEELIGKDKLKIEIHKGIFRANYNNIPVVGYKRRMSMIINKAGLAQEIKLLHSGLVL